MMHGQRNIKLDVTYIGLPARPFENVGWSNCR